MSLQGQTVLVTGGARRIGRAVVWRLAESGARVVIHYHRSETEARQLVGELVRRGREAIALPADLSDPNQVAALAARAGTVHALVNNASIFERASAATSERELWDRHMAVNARAPYLLAAALVPGMQKMGGGVIVNVLDALVERPIRGYGAYVASKAALWGLTRQGAKEWAPEVRVNGVALGPVVPEAELDLELEERIAQRLPMGRWGKAEEVAAVVHFLVAEATFATGAVWQLDGGMAIQ